MTKRKLFWMLSAMLSIVLLFGSAITVSAAEETSEDAVIEAADSVEDAVIQTGETVSGDKVSAGESESAVGEALNGLVYNAALGRYEYLKNGEIDTSVTGLFQTADGNSSAVYIKAGIFDATFESKDSGLVKFTVKDFDASGNGEFKISGTVYGYVFDGMLLSIHRELAVPAKNDIVRIRYGILMDSTYAKLAKKGGAKDYLDYCTDGFMRLDNRYDTSSIPNAAVIKNGKLDKQAKGGYLTEDGDNGYLKAGVVDTSFTGIAKTTLVMYLSADGRNTGVEKHNIRAYYENGKINFGFSGFKKDGNKIYYVEHGLIVNDSYYICAGSYGWLHYDPVDGCVMTSSDEELEEVPKSTLVGVTNGLLDFKKNGFFQYSGGDFYCLKKGIFNPEFNSEKDGFAKITIKPNGKKKVTLKAYAVNGIVSLGGSTSGLFKVKNDYYFLAGGSIFMDKNYVKMILIATDQYNKKNFKDFWSYFKATLNSVAVDDNSQNAETYGKTVKLKNGKLDRHATGLFGAVYGGSYYITNGIEDNSFSGIAQGKLVVLLQSSEGSPYPRGRTINYIGVVKNGKLDSTATGLYKYGKSYYLFHSGVARTFSLGAAEGFEFTGAVLFARSKLTEGNYPPEIKETDNYIVLYFNKGKFTKKNCVVDRVYAPDGTPIPGEYRIQIKKGISRDLQQLEITESLSYEDEGITEGEEWLAGDDRWYTLELMR